MNRLASEEWIRAHVEPVGAIETAHERPWATVLRVPLAEGVAWFKACSPVQGFEPRLTAGLFARWPIGVFSNPPEAWLARAPGTSTLE